LRWFFKRKRLLLRLRRHWLGYVEVTAWVAIQWPERRFMPVNRFLDTNVLLYAYDLDAPAKRAVARAIVEEAWLQPGRTALSV